MKNKLFHKAAALAIGSLAVFSAQALALGSNHQRVTNADALNNSEIVIAQQDTVGACAQVEAVVQVLGQTITRVEQVEKIIEIQELQEIPPEFRDPIVNSLKQSVDTLAQAQVIAEQDKDSQVFITITTVIGVLDNVAEAIAQGQVGQIDLLNGAKRTAENGCEFQ